MEKPETSQRIARRSRDSLIKAMAYAVETMCSQPLMETQGAITDCMRQDDRIWEHLSEQTIHILGEGLGIYPPDTTD